MNLGAVRKTDVNGRVQIPLEIRKYLNLDDCELCVYVEDKRVIIEPIYSTKGEKTYA